MIADVFEHSIGVAICADDIFLLKSDASTTPTATSLSEVIVPVLSNKHESIFPAIGTRNGSVQYTPDFINAKSAVFTAMAVCMGSSGGTTDVKIKIHLNTNSYCERLPSFMPTVKT